METVVVRERQDDGLTLPIPRELEKEIEAEDKFVAVVDRKRNRIVYKLQLKEMKKVDED